jgi:hypothetical protein
MKKWTLAAVLAFAGSSASQAPAWDGPFATSHPSPSGYGKVVPVFQAAPWYLYWPYDAHFLTPAPVYGAYYAPPMMGNYPVQPYFPAPQYTPPVGYPGPMQGPPVAAPPVGK